jgi:hypothetical protein
MPQLQYLPLPGTASGETDAPRDSAGAARRLAKTLGFDLRNPETLVRAVPFGPGDTTAGSESELQAVVLGARQDVDLARAILESAHYKNLARRAAAGDTPKKTLDSLEKHLADNPENVWENSWVRFPCSTLSPFASGVFERDLFADKNDPASPIRNDAHRFLFERQGEPWARLPVSYLLRLSLAEAISAPFIHADIRRQGLAFMEHFLNDNTSPETFSLYTVRLSPSSGMGRAIARETCQRFHLCQLLIQYANLRFRLAENGQKALVYQAPNPPARQKALNALIPDAFYRELFMSPCLSGWDRGEEKHRYMELCHEVLSRSHLNAVAKLREAGIIVNNLVVLPSTSNVSLANNGTHVSLGSRVLSALLDGARQGFGPTEEKCLGDLVIKAAEHFLPLFTGTYGAAPCRMDFTDFHPEKALGFLPHELDFTHLRMFWRRWRKKARISLLGQPLTPFGPEWIDGPLCRFFGLKGDLVPDYRLMDYLAALMSTAESPALDGRQGNDERLRRDLSALGVFDSRMALYLLLRLRRHETMGFSGFEARQFSLFPDIVEDMGQAVSLQNLVLAHIWKLVLSGELAHRDIPDEPFVESERRQIVFYAAVGVPAFYARRDSPNRLLKRILARVKSVRISRRYPGYCRVACKDYLVALLTMLREDSPELVDAMGLEGVLEDALARVLRPEENGAAGRLVREILAMTGAPTPFHLTAEEFNQAAEKFYRETLRRRHAVQGMDILAASASRLDGAAILGRGDYREALFSILGGQSASACIGQTRAEVEEETADEETLARVIRLSILAARLDAERACA